MVIGLGTTVFTSDGKELGGIDRLVIDASRSTVQSIVVRKGLLLPQELELSLSDLQRGDEDSLYVPYTAEQVESLPQFQPTDSGSSTNGSASLEGYPEPALYMPAGFSVPMPIPSAEPPPTAEEWARSQQEDSAPPSDLRQQQIEHVTIGAGSEVIARDGKKLGSLHSLDFDLATRRFTAVGVRRGFIFTEDQQLPASLISEIGNGLLTLALDSDQLTARMEVEREQKGGSDTR